MSDMQINEAIAALADGHTIWKVSYAKRVCKALGIPFNETALVELFYSESDWKGAHMKPGCEGSMGVYALTLSHYAAKQLGVNDKAGSYIGRGSQAREYARVVAERIHAAPSYKRCSVCDCISPAWGHDSNRKVICCACAGRDGWWICTSCETWTTGVYCSACGRASLLTA